MQVEERLRFYDDGVAPRKNATVMGEAMENFKEAGGAADLRNGDEDMADPEPVEEKPKKKKKKKRTSVRALQTCVLQSWPLSLIVSVILVHCIV